MKRIFTLAFLLTFISPFYSQINTSYENSSKWFLGINGGATWQTTDVENKFGPAGGLTLGRSFNYNYGKSIYFDIRGRFLYGYWYGQDYDSTNFEYPNYALSTGTTNYQDSLGYSVNNFRSENYRLGLELVIHLNSLRERTGLDPYIFGGVGITWHQTKGNLTSYTDTLFDESIYDYNSLNSFDKNSIKGLLDDSYETALDGSDANFFNPYFMPSLGFGLAYQVSPHFSIGFEHKSTFTRNDSFDGYINPDSKYKNDIYHYTSAYLQFRFKHHTEDDQVIIDQPKPDINNVNNTNPNIPPVVSYRNPASSGTVVNTPNYLLRAEVLHVNGKSNISFIQNGNYNGNFSYNATSKELISNVVLNPGQNVFEITATNPFGNDVEQTIIIYEREEKAPPVVTITNPGSSPYQTATQVFPFAATVLNVDGKNNISVNVNGQTTTNFSYNLSTRVLNMNITLNLGSNIVTVTGTNEVGQDTESTTIIYRPEAQQQPPVVIFTDPSVSPYTVQTPNFDLRANVIYVSGSQHITFKQNGTVNSNFTFNAGTNSFQSNVILVPGQNIFEIIGTNSAGSASASTIIIYERQAPKPPVVTFNNPNTNPYTVGNVSFNMQSTVLNVTTSNQISVKLNNVSINNFNFDANTHLISAILNLQIGNNTVEVRGTNNDGTDSKQTVIIYRPVQTEVPPIVTFVNPNTNPYTVSTSTYNVSATVFNVANQSGINVNLNGNNLANFNFNTASKLVSFNAALIEGANVITITGSNTVGTDSKTQTIIYRKEQVVQPPIVSFIDPIQNPTTVYSPLYNVQAKVRFVSGAQNIQLKINGTVSTNFTYSASSEIMTFNTSLVFGSNIIEIKGTNTAGYDQKSTTIIYRQIQTEVPPVVTITQPQPSTYTVNTSSTPITATVLNVSSAQNITVTVNGGGYNNFTYNSVTKVLQFVMNLNEGVNSLTVSASNSVGQASDTRSIIYRKDVVQNPPTVVFTNPAQPGTTVSQISYQVRANVMNVSGAQNIVLKQNGISINPSLYTFNQLNNEVVFNTSLNNGNNLFEILASNNSGTASASTSIILRTAPCKKPNISLVNPNSANTDVDVASFNFSTTVIGITNANGLTFKVNGIEMNGGNYNASSGSFTQTILLNEGSNVFELIATNDCGSVNENMIVNFSPKQEPCKMPQLFRLSPNSDKITTELNSIAISATTANVVQNSELNLTVNGTVAAFNFDVATQMLNANVNLIEGKNTITLLAANNCGRATLTWDVTKNTCKAPFITITSSTENNNATTTNSNIVISASVDNVLMNNQISVTQNSIPVNFVFNPQAKTLTIARDLSIGLNTFNIIVNNACGKDSETLKVTRKELIVEKPPVVNITNPASSPFTTNTSAMNIIATVENVVSASQISVLLNNQNVNFNFNQATGSVSFNADFIEGSNNISITAVNNAGNANDVTTVVYNKPVVELPPVVVITNPARCPAGANVGNFTIQGTIQNVSQANQVVITLNGQIVPNFTFSVNNNVLTFSVVTNLTSGTNMPFSVQATNSAGSDIQNCQIEVAATNNTNTNNTNTGTIGGGSLINGGNSGGNLNGGGNRNGGEENGGRQQIEENNGTITKPRVGRP